jgi:pimeloyl-ACP methyl ester carboxylesterase
VGAFGTGGLGNSGRIPLPPVPRAALEGERVLHYTIHGARSGITAQVVVGLPRSYAAASAAALRYPVIETFSGYPSSPSQFLETMGLGGAVDTAVSAHTVADAIIVSPQLEVPPGRDTECVNGSGSPVETWLTQDVPDWVLHTFRATPDRRGWTTMGLSAGGWCAAMATMLHPDRYAAAVVLGGYFRPSFSGYVPFSPGSAEGRRYDLVARAKDSPPPVAIWLETSHSDSVSYGSSAAFLAATRGPTIVQAEVLTHAGHRISLWEGLLPTVLRWLGTTVPGFAPGA